jgi:hypothetical protein
MLDAQMMLLHLKQAPSWDYVNLYLFRTIPLMDDNAYTLNETMLVPYPGQNIHITHPELETFNFYQSQLRITIECTFGVFVRRWGILWKSMEYNLALQFEIVHACCRLHNFCIQRRIPTFQINGITDPIVATNAEGVLTDP